MMLNDDVDKYLVISYYQSLLN